MACPRRGQPPGHVRRTGRLPVDEDQGQAGRVRAALQRLRPAEPGAGRRLRPADVRLVQLERGQRLELPGHPVGVQRPQYPVPGAGRRERSDRPGPGDGHGHQCRIDHARRPCRSGSSIWPPYPGATWIFPQCQGYSTLPALSATASNFGADQEPAFQAKAMRKWCFGGGVLPNPPGGPQQPCAAFGLMDTSEARFLGLSTASLENAAGNFVAPTTTSLEAAAAAFTACPAADLSCPAGTYTNNYADTNPAAYPLTNITYAIVPDVDAPQRRRDGGQDAVDQHGRVLAQQCRADRLRPAAGQHLQGGAGRHHQRHVHRSGAPGLLPTTTTPTKGSTPVELVDSNSRDRAPAPARRTTRRPVRVELRRQRVERTSPDVRPGTAVGLGRIGIDTGRCAAGLDPLGISCWSDWRPPPATSCRPSCCWPSGPSSAACCCSSGPVPRPDAGGPKEGRCDRIGAGGRHVGTRGDGPTRRSASPATSQGFDAVLGARRARSNNEGGHTFTIPAIPYRRLTGFALVGVAGLLVLFLVYLYAFTPLTASPRPAAPGRFAQGPAADASTSWSTGTCLPRAAPSPSCRSRPSGSTRSSSRGPAPPTS